jgi:tricorn protease
MWLPSTLLLPLAVAGPPAWVRTPTLAGDTVVFAAAGALWRTGLAGGVADPVDTGGALAERPAFSPDGRWLAWSGRVDGNLEIFVQAWPDGTPQRLTWHGAKDEVVGWSAGSAAVWFRSGRHDPSGYAEVFSVPVGGGTVSRLLPTPQDTPGMSESAAAEPGGARWVVTDRHAAWLAWARNTGGTAPGLRVGPAEGPMPRICPTPAWDPHWVDGRIWFTSDADGWPRLGSMSPDGGEVDWHTADAPGLRDLDVAADGRAVFVRDGALRVWSAVDGERAVPVELPDRVRPREAPVPLLGEDARLLAEGARLAVARRGQVVELDAAGRPAGVHARAGVRYGPAALADGRVLAQAHDGQAARLVWSRPGKRRDRALGDALDAPLVALSAAPGARHAAGVDTLRRVWWIDLETGERRELGRSEIEAPSESLSWRADGRGLAFVLRDAQGQRGVFLAGPEGAVVRVSDARVDAHAPAWSPDGLVFLAEQAPEIVLDHRDVAFVSRHAALPMLAPLDGAGALGRPRPVGAPGAWSALIPSEEGLLGRKEDALLPVDGGEAWAEDVGACAGAAPLCLGEAGVVRPAPGGAEAVADLSQATLVVDRRAEWVQIVGEACGQVARHRWDRGYDREAWQGACERARAAALRVADRRELNDVLWVLLAEISAAHAFAWGGDRPLRDGGPKPALLGADLSWTGRAWRVDRVLEPDAPIPTPAPLADAGVPAGTCIHAVDGVVTTRTRPPSALLPRGAGGPARLLVGPCDGAGVEDVAVQPVVDESALRLSDRVRVRSADVERRSGGRLGYIYMPDVNDLGLVAFEQAWAGQRGREGVILDLRRNGGGWYSDAIVDRLSRGSGARFRWTGGGEQTWPIRSGGVPVVVLVDAGTMSEGEILTRGLQLRGATVIGEPTWGGLSGDVSPRPLVDGGGVGVPAVVWVDPEHGTALERVGIRPDVSVAQPWVPGAGDPWIDAALQHFEEAP